MLKKSNFSKIIIIFSWIGYKHRVHTLDYKARKKDLTEIDAINKQTLNIVGNWANNMLYQREKDQYEKQRREFDNLAINLHHLISTDAIPGVYNSPYIPDDKKPQVFGANVETHIKNNIKYYMLGNNDLNKTFNTISQGKVDLNDLKNKLAKKKKDTNHSKKISTSKEF